MEWLNRVIEKSRTDLEYQDRYNALQKQEQGFLLIRDAMSPDQREQLDNYISACEEMDHAMLRLAYLVGREDQR